jgi:secreted PhoX family phosphatase
MKAFPPFRAVEANFADTITLPAGYRYQILAPWGEKMNDAGDTIGFNHDYVGYFPIDMLDGGNSSTDALLTINHEYVNPLFVGGNTKERTPEQIRTEMRSVGVSVVRVRREGSEWKVVMDPRNRRIDGMTEIALTGPARGQRHPRRRHDRARQRRELQRRSDALGNPADLRGERGRLHPRVARYGLQRAASGLGDRDRSVRPEQRAPQAHGARTLPSRGTPP